MPPNNRIRRLRDLLPGDLSQDKLDTFSREFDALAQDSPKSSCSLSCITFAGGSPPRWLARLFPSRGFKN